MPRRRVEQARRARSGRRCSRSPTRDRGIAAERAPSVSAPMPSIRSSAIVSAPSGSTAVDLGGDRVAPGSPTARSSGRTPKISAGRARRRRASAGGRASRAAPRTSRPSSTVAGTRFIGGLPRKPATNGVGGPAIDLERRADLHDLALVHDADAAAHRHRLDLVVGDVDHGRAEAPVQLDQLAARRDAQRRVEVRQRLVEQEDLRVAHDRAAERHALALAAGKRVGLALEQRREAERAGDVAARGARSRRLSMRRRRRPKARLSRTVMCG